MQPQRLINVLVFCIALLAVLATTQGIFSNKGAGAYSYTSIRGKEVPIYGKGIYRHMSAEVAPQGIAQDYVTLSIGVPLLLVGFFWARSGSYKGRLLLAGTTGYFLVTYLFYLVMGMYNLLFLVYVLLTSASFFLFFLLMQSLNTEKISSLFAESTATKTLGGFLLFSAISIALLWLSIVIPPLLDGSIVPLQVEHYTTLIVQGIDLAILLPAAFIVGLLFIRKKHTGYLWAPVYFVFLSILMTALTAKVAAMGMLGYNIIPVVFIIPVFNLASVIGCITVFRSMNEKPVLLNEAV